MTALPKGTGAKKKAGPQMGAMLSPKDVEKLYGVTTHELWQWRHRDQGPAYYLLGRNTVRYALKDITEWFNDVANELLHDYPVGR